MISMKNIIYLFLVSSIAFQAHAELVLVSGKAKQKNYIDTSSIVIKNNPKEVTYNQLVFFDENFEIQKFRHSVSVQTNIMNCDTKTWYSGTSVRKTTDQKKTIEVLDRGTRNVRPVINAGPVKYIYDHYCK